MTPNLPPVLPGFSEPVMGPLKEAEYRSKDIAGIYLNEWKTGYSGMLEIWFSLRLGSAIARANGIGGEPTFEGIKYGDVIPANPSADHRESDWSVIQTYLLNLKEGDRVVECGVCASTGHKGTIKLKGGGTVVEWDAIKGGVMTTSLTGGTRRISDVIQPTSDPCESVVKESLTTESPKPDEVEDEDEGGLCVKCGGPNSRNPHPDAGKLDKLMEVGAMWECIPCCFGRSMRARKRASEAESDLAAAREDFETAMEVIEEKKDEIRKLKQSEKRLRAALEWTPISKSLPNIGKEVIGTCLIDGDWIFPVIGTYRGRKTEGDSIALEVSDDDFHPCDHWRAIPLPPEVATASSGKGDG